MGQAKVPRVGSRAAEVKPDVWLGEARVSKSAWMKIWVKAEEGVVKKSGFQITGFGLGESGGMRGKGRGADC